MQAIEKHQGIAAILDQRDIDTDQIVPKQFLKRVERSGFGAYLFFNWRFSDKEGKELNSDFILNQQRYTKASILVTGENFGCGSSREHAPWALEDYGFRVIIAPSFADIFYNNCFNSAILAIRLEKEKVRKIIDWIKKTEQAAIDVDLREQSLQAAEQTYHFHIEERHKKNLLEGNDHIDLSLKHLDKIKVFEEEHFARFPFYRIK